MKDLTAFPTIHDWLNNLDASPHGADGHNFAQYASNFDDKGIKCVHEIADPDTFSCTDLLAVCPGMKLGTANLLLTYAQDDVKVICKLQMNMWGN